MEALVSQTLKSLKTPRNSRSNTTRLRELWPEGSYQLSPSLIPLDRVPEGACQENHQTIVPCSLPQQLPSTPGLFSSLKLHPSGFQGTDKASAHPPGSHTVFHGSTTSCCSSQKKLHWEELGAGQKSSVSAPSTLIWFQLVFNIILTLCMPALSII